MNGSEIAQKQFSPENTSQFSYYNHNMMVEMFYVYVDMPLEHHITWPLPPSSKKTVSQNHDHTHTQLR